MKDGKQKTVRDRGNCVRRVNIVKTRILEEEKWLKAIIKRIKSESFLKLNKD